tara:strand:+ start:400 stop:546 length:147 start_codon:yes stop_codon:yes gene_type:complete
MSIQISITAMERFTLVGLLQRGISAKNDEILTLTEKERMLGLLKKIER